MIAAACERLRLNRAGWQATMAKMAGLGTLTIRLDRTYYRTRFPRERVNNPPTYIRASPGLLFTYFRHACVRYLRATVGENELLQAGAARLLQNAFQAADRVGLGSRA